MKKTIALSESQFRNVIKESVKRILKEDMTYKPLDPSDYKNPETALQIAKKVELYASLLNGFGVQNNFWDVAKDTADICRTMKKMIARIEEIINNPQQNTTDNDE